MEKGEVSPLPAAVIRLGFNNRDLFVKSTTEVARLHLNPSFHIITPLL